MFHLAQGSKADIRKRCAKSLLLVALLCLLVCVGCAGFQRRLIYYPEVHTPAEVDELAGPARLKRWTGSDGQALGWKRLNQARPSQGCVLVMHGNACCAFQCGGFANVIQHAAPLDVYILEYPGYADCPGAPCEREIDRVAEAGFRALPANAPRYLVGQSLGTGVAAHVAGQFPTEVDGIVLLAPYDGLADVAQAHVRIFPARWILSEHYPAEDDLKNFSGPVAVLVGGQDRVVPQKLGRRLYDGYAGPKRIWEFPEADHETVMVQPSEVWKQILDFLAEHRLEAAR